MLFQSHLRPRGQTIGLVADGHLRRITVTVRDKNGNITPITNLVGDTFSWGSADNTTRAHNNYRARQSTGKKTLRTTSVKAVGMPHDFAKYKLEVVTQERISTAPQNNPYWASNPGFQGIIQSDSITMAFLDELPELVEPFTEFCSETRNWWVLPERHSSGGQQHGGEPDSPVRLIHLNLTLEKAEKLAKKINESWKYLLETQLSEYKVRTCDKLGFYDNVSSPLEHLYTTPTNQNWVYNPLNQSSAIQLSSWLSTSQYELDSKEVKIITKNGSNLHQKFDHYSS